MEERIILLRKRHEDTTILLYAEKNIPMGPPMKETRSNEIITPIVNQASQGRSTCNVLGVPVGKFMCSTVRGASCRKLMECGKGNGFAWVPPLLYTSINNSLRDCASWWMRSTKFSVLLVGIPLKGVGKNVSIHRFPKRENAGQRWVEAWANPYLSRLEYLQVL